MKYLFLFIFTFLSVNLLEANSYTYKIAADVAVKTVSTTQNNTPEPTPQLDCYFNHYAFGGSQQQGFSSWEETISETNFNSTNYNQTARYLNTNVGNTSDQNITMFNYNGINYYRGNLLHTINTENPNSQIALETKNHYEICLEQ